MTAGRTCSTFGLWAVLEVCHQPWQSGSSAWLHGHGWRQAPPWCWSRRPRCWRSWSRDVSGALIFGALGYALVGSLILARRPGHRMGPLLCAIALAAAFSDFVFVYTRYTLDALAGVAALRDRVSLDQHMGLCACGVPYGFRAAAGVPGWPLAVAALAAGAVGALLIVPLSAVGRAFTPETMGSALNYLPNPYAIPSAERVFEDNDDPGRRVRAYRPGRGQRQRGTALAAVGAGRAPAAQMVSRDNTDLGGGDHS